MEISYTALLNVVEVGLDALEVLGEALGVHHHTENVIARVPVGDFSACVVEVMLEVVGAFFPALPEHRAEVIECLFVAAVKLIVEPLQLVVMFCEPVFKFIHGRNSPLRQKF